MYGIRVNHSIIWYNSCVCIMYSIAYGIGHVIYLLLEILLSHHSKKIIDIMEVLLASNNKQGV